MSGKMRLSIDPRVRVAINSGSSDIPAIYRTKKVIPTRKDDVWTISQEDFNEENTKYIIQYICILSEDVTIPEGCLIEFDGGAIINGENLDKHITGNNTVLISCLDYDTVLAVETRGSFTRLGYEEINVG